MPLFDVKGWGLDDAKVVPGVSSKKIKKKEKKEKRDREYKEKKRDREETEQREVKRVRKEQKEKARKEVKALPPPPSIEKDSLTPLQKKMLNKLSGSRFRWINEQLYTTDSEHALALIEKQPELFEEYHKGFRSQVESWPENPVNLYIRQLVLRGVSRPLNAPGGFVGIQQEDGHKKLVVADMGCGEAQLAVEVDRFMSTFKKEGKKSIKGFVKKFGGDKVVVKNRRLAVEVHSFDLKKINDKITVADIRHVPLASESCSVVIFCLALMGTNFLDFITEAKRILAPGGELWIAEIQSRLTDTTGEKFAETLDKLGFRHKTTDTSNKMFTRFEFVKPAKSAGEKLADVREEGSEDKWLLKPCIYKRR